MNDKLLLSIIIPCRNEGKYIKSCLDSIISNGFPLEAIEVLVVDGMSGDGTREIVKNYESKYPCVRLLDNPKFKTTTALNLGVSKSSGYYVLILGAHTEIDKNYLKNNVESIEKYSVDCVGGVIKTCPTGDSPRARSIAMALSHPFGVGNAHFRIGAAKPKYVDTVPYGCYKREVFNKIGLFNENLVRNQDIEFNLRLLKAGGKIMLVPGISSCYYARSTLKALAHNNYMNGFWVINSMRFARLPFSMRHLIPLVFVTTIILSAAGALNNTLFSYLFLIIMGIYIATDMFVSLLISRVKEVRVVLYLLLAFPLLHVSYGIGSIAGIVKLASSRLGGG